MRRHLDRNQIGGHPGAGRTAWKHHVGVGVVVIDAEQAALLLTVAGVERNVADEIVVVVKLDRLGRRALVMGVERRRLGAQRIAPADQDIRRVPARDVVGAIDAVGDFGEGEGGRGRHRRALGRWCEIDRQSGGGGAQQGLERAAAAKAPVDHIADARKRPRRGGWSAYHPRRQSSARRVPRVVAHGSLPTLEVPPLTAGILHAGSAARAVDFAERGGIVPAARAGSGERRWPSGR